MSIEFESGGKQIHIILLSGGGGGARLVGGVIDTIGARSVTVVSNTGDDFEHLGLLICPDTDSLLYTLSRELDEERGWGRSAESWEALAEIKRLGGPDWFQLGDKDLALHLFRNDLIQQGMNLSEATSVLAQRLGVYPSHVLIPASDLPIRTRVITDQGEMSFQHYFVKNRCEPKLERIYYDGIEFASPAPRLISLLDELSDPVDVILAPSNPFLSLGPILDIPGMAGLLRERARRIVAVSPIVGGHALKGPAAKIMSEFSITPNAEAWMEYLERRYPQLIDVWVWDQLDRKIAEHRPHSSRDIRVTDTVMRNRKGAQRLAAWLMQECLDAG